MDEEVYYNDQSVLVTKTRYVTGGKTYSMRNISSVHMDTIPPNNSPAIWAIGIGVLLMIFGGPAIKVIGGAFLLIGGFVIASSKPKYSVKINSNSGEIDSLSSDNKDYIENIVKQINYAIVKG